MSTLPINRKIKAAGEKFGFVPKAGRQVHYGYIDSPTATKDHYSIKISSWIDKNKDDADVQKHFPEHDGNGGNVMLHLARKGKMHPLSTHPNFPSDAMGYLQYEKEKAKSSKSSIQMKESQDNLMKKNHTLSEDSLNMSKELIHHLIHKRYDNADSILKEELMNVVQQKLEEKKKMIAAGLTTEGLFRKAQTDPSTGKPITRTKALKAAMKLNKGNFAVPAAIAAGGIATGAGIVGTSPKGLAEGKSPKEAVEGALKKYFKGNKFTTGKEALKKSDEERGSDKDFQKWKKKRAEKAND